MKSNKLILMGLFLFSIIAIAQPRIKEKREQIKALKVAFITNELGLTSEEAATFWPLYNAYDNKQMEIRHKKIKSLMDKVDKESIDNMSEKEAALLLAQTENIDEEVFMNRKKFINSLKGIIPSVKIIKLKRAEDDFNKKLLHQYRERGPRN